MSEELLQQPLEWIDSDSSLEEACTRWQSVNVLALDTEFIRTNTYYPVAGLIQVNDGKINSLIDPTVINDWYPLIDILDSDDHVIAMHSCSEDLELLKVELGTLPKNIFDTQVAAAFIGQESSLGYAKLVKNLLDVDLPKSETRSDWLQRPLSQSQKHYAALDVEFLRILAIQIIEELKTQKRLDWVLEEGARVYKQFKQHQNVSDSYKKIKSAWKLSPRRLAVLMALAKWRENYAQSHNVPRNRVVKEKSLYELAVLCPTHVSQLRKVEGVNERVIRKQGKAILSIVKEQLELTENELPQAMAPPLNKEDRELLKSFKEHVAEEAQKLGIASEIMMRKKEIEKLVRMKLENDWSSIESFFTGWRHDAIAHNLIQSLKNL